jgi:hypothetical protein
MLTGRSSGEFEVVEMGTNFAFLLESSIVGVMGSGAAEDVQRCEWNLGKQGESRFGNAK